MARYTDAVCKLCRNEGVKLFLKGSRCYTTKCAIERRRYGPGQHGQARKKHSEYALQLREKQKVRRAYGLLEAQFSAFYRVASAQKKVPTGLKVLQLCESRLDNIVHRSGLVPSRAQARQLITHGHFTVDGVRSYSPSHQLKPGQVVGVTEKSKKLVKALVENNPSQAAPNWMTADLENLTTSIVNPPSREDLDPTIKEALIVEYYSRR
ncbi:MAG: 30S ribosomal protein S4 [Cyanobacteria bacterium HKST-UBA02]|nr:30S ribosomal protein S4 [Cyanobacteria bacterium HKST-UBA02]